VTAAKKSPCPKFTFLEQSAGSYCPHKAILNPVSVYRLVGPPLEQPRGWVVNFFGLVSTSYEGR
jgi:hypothetical protein